MSSHVSSARALAIACALAGGVLPVAHAHAQQAAPAIERPSDPAPLFQEAYYYRGTHYRYHHGGQYYHYRHHGMYYRHRYYGGGRYHYY
jgi:hypothetical protein